MTTSPSGARAVIRAPLPSVALDARRWGRTGIGRYQSELYLHIRAIAPDLALSLVGGSRKAARDLGARWFRYSAELYSPVEQLFGGRAMRRAGADVYHFPHYAVPRHAPTPFVVTVHDLIHFRYPQHFGVLKVAIARRVLLRAVRRAARVICVSEATRRDLVAIAPAAATKAGVIHEGVAPRFQPAAPASVEAVRARHQLGRYVLSMGDRAPHKRFDLVAAAFDHLRARDGSLQLVIVGERGGTRAGDPPGAVRLDYVSDEDLQALYTGAACLLFPSDYEGFGLPPLEAMASGCPVVCTRGSSLDEVCGPGAMQVDTGDARGLAGAAWTLLSDDQVRADLAERGRVHAARFSWTRAAERTLDVLRDAARH